MLDSSTIPMCQEDECIKTRDNRYENLNGRATEVVGRPNVSVAPHPAAMSCYRQFENKTNVNHSNDTTPTELHTKLRKPKSNYIGT